MPDQKLLEIVDEPQQQHQPHPPKFKPQPLLPLHHQDKLLKLVRQSVFAKQLKRGINEVLRALQKQRVELVIMAADCDPLELVMGLGPMCEQRDIGFCFVNNQAALGRACDIKRPVVAAAIIYKEESQLASQIVQMKDLIDQLLY